jgi:hypothetical protein
MRSTLLTTTAILGLLAAPMFAHIAVAQTATAPFARPGNVIGSGDSLPLGSNASNISGSDTEGRTASGWQQSREKSSLTAVKGSRN